MNKVLKTYELQINEDPNSQFEVDYVALVDAPAIEKNFLKFNQNVNKLHFAAINEDRQIISGAAMLANTPIYRIDEQTGEEYNIVFKPKTIEQIAMKFFEKGFNQNFNLMHDPTQILKNVTIFESFINDESRGIKPMAGFEDAPQGSWFISAKVNDAATWAKIKSGEVKGFSVEGCFAYKKSEMTLEEKMAQIEAILNAE